MGSPKKRMANHAAKTPLEENTRYGIRATPGTSGHKSKKWNTVFASKRFYLDIKTKNVGSLEFKQLITDLRKLGGIIEEFFSREVTTVISDTSEAKLRSIINYKSTPTAPGTTAESKSGFAPSPATSVSLTGAANSPWSPVSVEDSKKIPAVRSRAETILDRARQQSSRVRAGSGSGASTSGADVLENAARWGMQIWSLHKVVSWLDNFRNRCNQLRRIQHETTPKNQKTVNLYSRSQSVDTALQFRNIIAPYVKFEVTNHMYRPVYQEFRKFPQLYLNGKAGSSPFTLPESLRQKSRKNVKATQDENRLAAQNINRPVDHGKLPLQEQRQNAPRHEEAINKRQQHGGYCEICECPFTDLYEHLSSKIHQLKVAGDDLWTKLDVCIDKVNKGQSEDEEFNPDFSF